MFKPLARWFLPRAIRWLDDSISAEQLDFFLTQQLNRILPTTAWSDSDDRVLAERLADRTGLSENWLQFDITPVQAESSQNWLQQFGGKPVIQRGIVNAGSGFHLANILAVYSSPEQVSLLNDSLERLLRHVETQRQRSLQRFLPTLNNQQAWLERHAITRLFLLVARTRQDWRYLNAALKLNDWAFRAHSALNVDSPQLLRYLANLAEQRAILSEI